MSGAEQYLGGGDEGLGTESIRETTDGGHVQEGVGATALGGEGAHGTDGPETIDAAQQTLSDIRRFFTHNKPRVLSRGHTIGRGELRQHLADQIDGWASASAQSGILSHETARDRFLNMWYAYTNVNEHNIDCTDVSAAHPLWEQFWADTRQLHAAGFEYSSEIATYNDAATMCAYAEQSGDRDKVIWLSRLRFKDPIGRHRDYLEAKARLADRFGQHRYVTPKLIETFASEQPTDYEAKLQSLLDEIDSLAETFAGVEGFDEQVIARAALSRHPEERVRYYLKRRTWLKDIVATPGNDNDLRLLARKTQLRGKIDVRHLKELFSDRATRDTLLRDLALSSKAQNRAGMLEAALEYARNIDELTEFVNDRGVPMDQDILQFVAATTRRSSIYQRYVQARGLQERRDSGDTSIFELYSDAAAPTEPAPLPPEHHNPDPVTADSPAEDSPSSHQAETTKSTGRNIDPASTLEHLTSTLGGIALEHIPSTVGGIDERIEAIRERIASIQSNITESNRRESEARISTLQQAVSNLEGAANVLSQGNNSVADFIGGYVEEVGGSE